MAMIVKAWTRIWIFATLLCCSAAQASHPIDQQIASLKAKLAHDKQRQHSASNRVEAVEVKIGKISAQLHHTQNRLESQKNYYLIYKDNSTPTKKIFNNKKNSWPIK